MGPKPRPQGTKTDKSASSFKALDDFLAQSSEPGPVNQKEAINAQEQQIKSLKEKYFQTIAQPSLQHNMQMISNCRTMTLIFGGMTAGIFGLDGLQGMLFYLALVVIVSIIIAVRLGFSGKPYFENLGQAATSGMFANLLTYLLMWVMFHNLVYVL